MIKKILTKIRKGRRTRLIGIIALIAIIAPLAINTLLNSIANQVKADSFFKMDEGYGTTNAVNDTNSAVSAGSITGATWKTDDLCFDGKCLYFDGDSDFVSFADDADLDFTGSNSFTIALWFRHAPITTGTQVLVAKANASAGYKIWMESDGDITFATDDDSTWTTPDDYATSTKAIYDDNSWHHISAVKSGTTSLTLYIDGVKVAEDLVIDGQNTLENSASFYIGIDGDGASNDYKGFIDEVKVYRSAKTADEIKGDYISNSTLGGTSASFGPSLSYLSEGLVGYWKMDESSGDTSDYSGNSYTLTNNSALAYSAGKFGNAATCDGTADYLNTTTEINGIKSVSFWVNPASAANNYFINLINSSAYITINSSGVILATGFASPSIYVNGIQNGSVSASVWSLVTVTSDTTINANAFAVGLTNDGSNHYCTNTSKIDDIRLYNRTLSPGEVTSLYNWAPGPVAYHPLNENSGTSATADKSGNGYSGTLTSITDQNWTQGKFGSALDLDGTADFVDVGAGPGVVHTVSFWVKPDSTTEHFIDLNGSAYISAGSGTLSATGFTTPTYYVNGVQTSSPTVSSGVWQHIAVTTATSLNASDYDIGRLEGTDYLNGTIDDVKLYNYSRTSSQIIEDMNAGHPAPGSPVGSAYIEYEFDEGYNTTANNTGSGGSGLDGTITSGTWTNSGKFDKAITLSASSSVTDTISDLGNNNSISIWVYPTTSAASKTLVTASKLTTDSSSRPVYGGCTGTALSLSTWTHILAVSNGSTSCAIYQNGKLTSSGATGVTFGPSLNIGASSFTGNVDKFKLYTSALTAEQAKAEFNQGQMAVFGSTGTDSSGNASWSSANEYCPPGQDSACVGPFGYWKLDENTDISANDSSGNNITGTLINASGVFWKTGKFGSGYQPSTDGALIRLTNVASVKGLSEFTMEAWAYPTSYLGSGVWKYITNENSSDNSNWTRASIGTNNGYAGCGNNVFWALHRTAGGSSIAVCGTSQYQLNRWYHVVSIFNSNTDVHLLYINGVLDKSTSLATSAQDNNNPPSLPVIGNWCGGGTWNFNGIIDEVKYYNYARTPAQIAWDYSHGAPIAQYDFDECSGTTLNDVTPKADKKSTGYDGTISANTGNSVGICGGTVGDMWADGAVGKYSSSLDFDGADDYVSTNNAVLNSIETFSLASWIYLASPSNHSPIISEIDSSTVGGYALKVPGIANSLLKCNRMYSAGNVYTAASTIAVPKNRWVHVACVYQGSNNDLHVYLNGQDVTASVITETYSTSASGLTTNIGRYPISGTSYSYFNGQIDDVRIYNYALTAQQIKLLYNENSAVRFE